MIEKIKQEAMRRGMKLLTNPKVAKMMADPRFMSAITKGYELRGKVQSNLDCKLRTVASVLNLATKADLDSMQATLNRVQRRCEELERRDTEDGRN